MAPNRSDGETAGRLPISPDKVRLTEWSEQAKDTHKENMNKDIYEKTAGIPAEKNTRYHETDRG